MQAVIKAGGKQYIVKEGQTLNIDLVDSDAKKLEFEPLMVIEGDKVQVGAPIVSGVVVKAEVVEEVKGDKLKILKYKAKKRISRKTGHRQKFSNIKITGIGSATAKK
ncbi:MAG TPA: 50S ribosomal protein L21 [Candidatus Saccharimonadales bacterium]|nr:50S ribosomal protein L21 [Candidatus Saccharimonadales bacterium]